MDKTIKQLLGYEQDTLQLSKPLYMTAEEWLKLMVPAEQQVQCTGSSRTTSKTSGQLKVKGHSRRADRTE